MSRSNQGDDRPIVLEIGGKGQGGCLWKAVSLIVFAGILFYLGDYYLGAEATAAWRLSSITREEVDKDSINAWFRSIQYDVMLADPSGGSSLRGTITDIGGTSIRDFHNGDLVDARIVTGRFSGWRYLAGIRARENSIRVIPHGAGGR
ncbi:MAG TPA: hypothetical protein PLP29_18715 [Candidatus Ozemobacteraceae bacterium]|nr:hypothetical protein [Candidatus Ozemobacteraceae bacterium]